MGYFQEGEWPYGVVSSEENEVWADQSDLKKKIHDIIDSIHVPIFFSSTNFCN